MDRVKDNELDVEQYGKLYKEYTNLIEDKEKIKIKYANKNKKNIILNTIFLMITTSLFMILVKLNLIELFELSPKICMIVYNCLFIFSLGYEGYILFNSLCDNKKIYEGLSDDEEFTLIIKRIKEKEKELSNLNDKYMNLDKSGNDDKVISSYIFRGNTEEKDSNILENKLVRRRIK